jgi:hypothetical protein
MVAEAEQIQIGENWHWRWNGWVSPGFEYLESRPWTPLVIGDKLCFTVRANEQWRVVWSDKPGKIYDDVYDTVNFNEKPLYIAREQERYCLVWGQQESQIFGYQIKFKVEDSKVWIAKFSQRAYSFENGKSEAIWQESE